MRPSISIRGTLVQGLPYLWVAIATIIALYVLFGLRDFNPAYPIQPLSGDGYLSVYVAQALGENALLHNSRVGAPLGLDYYDFYQPDFIHQGILKCIALITGKALLAMNLYFLGSFVLIAWIAFYVFRQFGLSIQVSLVCAVLYAFTPSHLSRSYYHLFLSAYYAVPLAVMIALRIMIEPVPGQKPGSGLLNEAAGEGRSAREPGAKPYRATLRRFICFALMTGVLLGGSGVYYAFYSILFIGTAGCYAALRHKNWTYCFAGFMCAVIIGLSTICGMLPKVFYDLRAGSSTQVAQRNPLEESIYSLKVAELFLPIPVHRIAKLRAITQEYNSTFPLLNLNESGYAQLGIAGAIGLSALFIWPFLRTSRDKFRCLMRYLLILTLIGILFATTDGFGSLFAQLITAQLRAHTRIVFFIGFFALFGFGIVLEKLRSRLPQRASVQVGASIFLGSILICGLYDQSFAEMRYAHKPLKADFQRDERFFRRIESASPPGGMVLQLPYQGFPEQVGVNNTDAYGDLRAYLHTRHLRWSYPAILGRPDDEWIRTLSGNKTPMLVQQAALAGFCGIYVDRQGFPDGAVGFESELRTITGAQPIVSENGLLSFYSLTTYTSTLRKETKPDDWSRMVHDARPNLVLAMISGTYAPEVNQGRSFHWCSQKGKFEIFNATGREQKADLVGYLFAWRAGTSDVWFTISNHTFLAAATVAGNKFDIPLVLEPGENLVSFRTDAARVPAPADPREMYFQLSGARLIEH